MFIFMNYWSLSPPLVIKISLSAPCGMFLINILVLFDLKIYRKILMKN